MASFELTIEQLRARRGNKWRRFPPDVLPAPVADMDFAVPDEVQDAIEAITKLRDRVQAKIVGQADVIELLLLAVLADGHALLEGLPGLAKTRAVKTLEMLRRRHPEETIVVVSHADVVRSVLVFYAGMTLDFIHRFEIDPASVSILRLSDQGPCIRCVNSTLEDVIP